MSSYLTHRTVFVIITDRQFEIHWATRKTPRGRTTQSVNTVATIVQNLKMTNTVLCVRYQPMFQLF